MHTDKLNYSDEKQMSMSFKNDTCGKRWAIKIKETPIVKDFMPCSAPNDCFVHSFVVKDT